MSQKRKRSQDSEPQDGEHIFRSPPIEDRSSTFVGLFSPSLKPKELQSLQEITSASHKMLAWRRESNQQSITGGLRYTTDSDDDGEKYGGKRIAKVLDNMQVSGACVVARWYGGVLLGPARFDHIENCAKDAVQTWKDAVISQQSKKRKAEEDVVDKTKLVKVLSERDQSINVLRKLAGEKEEMLKFAQASEDSGHQSQSNAQIDGETSEKPVAPAKPAIDYESMTVDRLRALERARDATLSFLLKRIDKAEAELSTIFNDPDEPP